MIQYYAMPGLKERPLITFRMLPEHIIDTVCQVVGYSREEIFYRRRDHRMVMIRSVMMALLRTNTRLSLTEIANIFGMNHSNVINAAKALTREMTHSQVPGRLMEKIKSQLKY